VLAGVAFQRFIVVVSVSNEKSSNMPFHVVWRSADGGKSWNQVSHHSSSVSQIGGGDGLATNFALVAISSSLFMLGGSNTGTASKAIQRSDDGGETWTFAGLAPWKGRWSFGHLVSDEEEGTVVVAGGFAGWKIRYSDVWTGIFGA
jgi:hypothetical protein